MREIFFRGKRIDNGEWIYGFYYEANDIITDKILYHILDLDSTFYPHEGVAGWDVITETVGQYTGLTDKNGTKIFEGDILSGHLDELFPNEESRYLVVWHDYGWHIKCGNESFDTLEQWWVREFFNVIGNIYDNPELLKGNE